MMRLKPDSEAMKDQSVTSPCSWLNSANAPMLKAALIAVAVEIANDALAASTRPNRMALMTMRMMANTTSSGRASIPGADNIAAQQMIRASDHKPASTQCFRKRSKLWRRYAMKTGPTSSAPEAALLHHRIQ